MAWSDPGDFTSGQILTAAQMDSVREAMFFGQATFTNEAARDAAIPATGITLQEGMRAYLTAPTIPAATGAITGVPSGVTTIYDGAQWVCITPVAAGSNTSGTIGAAGYLNVLTGDTTAVSVTLRTGTTAKIDLFAFVGNSAGGNNNFMSVAVSGATTLAAADNQSTRATATTANYGISLARSFVLTALTAGTNTFTLNYKTDGGTLTFLNRTIAVTGIA